MLDNQLHTPHIPVMNNQKVTNLKRGVKVDRRKKFLAQDWAQTDHHFDRMSKWVASTHLCLVAAPPQQHLDDAAKPQPDSPVTVSLMRRQAGRQRESERASPGLPPFSPRRNNPHRLCSDHARPRAQQIRAYPNSWAPAESIEHRLHHCGSHCL